MLDTVGTRQIFVKHSHLEMVVIECLAHKYWMNEITI